MPTFFITGTDTGVGKTFFTAWLVRAWQREGRRAAALKPVSSGGREDAEILREASGGVLSLDEINPLHFREPAAPLVAARAEKRGIDFATENRRIRQLQTRFTHFAVEGVGGWRVPLAPDYDVREWARDLGWPVVVVARATLGTLNHTRLTVDSIRDAGLTCAGVILNAGLEQAGAGPSPDFDLARRTNLGLLHDLLLLPVFEFDRRAHASGKIPVWLGGEEI
jgi:dethiobiotin synthetase